MGASHPRHAAQDPRRMRRIALAVIAPVGVVTVAAMIWLWPPAVDAAPEQPGTGDQFEGVVTAVDREPCPDGQSGEPGEPAGSMDVNGCGTATVRVSEGTEAGRQVEVDLPNGPGAARVDEGDAVVLLHSSAPEGAVYSIVDHQRSTQLWVLAAAFVLAVVAFGRWRGVTALAGLGVTFALLVLFVVPAILAGEPPLLVAIVGSAAIVLTVLYLTHGFALSTSVAVLGTLASLTLTALLSAAAVAAMHLTGFADDASTIVGMVHSVNLQGLLLAGIVIGSLGVLDDVTVTQAATVNELARQPGVPVPAAVRRGHPRRALPHRLGDQHHHPGLCGLVPAVC